MEKERENIQTFKVAVSRHLEMLSVVQNLFQIEGSNQVKIHNKGN